jgi:A/G-specific adenine glycosylase
VRRPRSSPQAPDPAEVRPRLLAWYRQRRRDLPWRRTRDPYAIWISEAMLQQTRVETVVGYWERFLARFPTVEALAAAAEDDVLAAWSGLGYYRRARALRAAAQAMVERHAGRFPDELEAARALPGVGPYTAGAVLSIAFDRPAALVDGNVVRVFARWLGCDLEYAAATRWAWARAEELVPRDGGAGEWNQALMELGATVCTPREPRCAECPLQDVCVARAEGRQLELPRAKPRKSRVDVELEALFVARGAEVLLERRPSGGRMADLWQLPTLQLSPEPERASLFPPRYTLASLAADDEPLAVLRHSITHHRIVLRVHRAHPPAEKRIEPLAWIPRTRLGALALGGMARKALRALSSHQ